MASHLFLQKPHHDGIAVISWFVLTNTPKTCRWLSPKERALAAIQIKSENIGALDVINSIDGSIMRRAMTNPTTLVAAMIVIFDGTSNPQTRYVATFLIGICVFSVSPLVNT